MKKDMMFGLIAIIGLMIMFVSAIYFGGKAMDREDRARDQWLKSEYHNAGYIGNTNN